MRSLFAMMLSCALFPSLAITAEPVPPPIELVLEGRAIEAPALKYRMYPTEIELREGDAVPILLRLPWEQNGWMTKVAPTLHEWETRPLNAPEWATFEGGSVFPDRFYQEIKRAAFRSEAHWEYPIHETQSPHMILLPDVQGLRTFLRYGLAARIRYHLSRGELDLAREGILVGFANARHIAQTPFYINQLAAISIHRCMLDQTGELISQPASPNLYWALSTLPESLVEMEQAARLEGHTFEMTFPAVRDFDRPRSREEWKTMGRQLVEYLVESGQMEMPKVGGELGLELSIRSVVIKRARPDLTERMGIPAEKVAAMSDEEAGLRWYTHLRMSLDQKAAAIYSLPPREAWPEYRRLKAEALSFHQLTGMKHWAHISPSSVYMSAWSLKRKIASLRIIEAVRHYMVSHENRLPTTLDEIQDVSIPRDPLTDTPFEWQVDGQTATLKAPSFPKEMTEWLPESAPEYRIRVR